MKKIFLTLLSSLLLVSLSACSEQETKQVARTAHHLYQKHQRNTTRDNVQNNNPSIPQPDGKATFTTQELHRSRRGWIRYGRLDSQGRATAANALITKNMIGKGSSANPNIRPAGFISGKAGHSRGHLIGRQLGGSGNTMRNLVTLYQNPVNTPYMTKYENEVRDVVESGNPVRYRVTPVYKRGKKMPESVVIEAKTLYNNKLNYKVTIPNKQ